MIHFVVALPAEAKPLIDYYGLNAVRSEHFKIYEGDGYRLIVSGVGKIKAAEAVSFLQTFSDAHRNQIWMNVGVGGHPKRDLGEGILAHKIVDQASGETWYPPLAIEAPCVTDSILTVNRPETEYQESVVYDMEASGFYPAATQFSTAELVQCFKVISDNRTSSPKNISARSVERWIEENVKTIDRIAKQLTKLAEKLPSVDVPSGEFQKFMEHWHFTVSEQHRLRRLLMRLKTLEPKVEFWPELETLKKSKDVFNCLEDRIRSLPVRL